MKFSDHFLVACLRFTPCALGIAASAFVLTGFSDAAVVTYLQQDGNLTSETGTGNGTASAYGTGGSAPTYSAVVPGTIITSGGNIVNDSNTSSLSYVNPNPATSNSGSAAGNVTIQGSSLGLSSTTNFTIEAFVNATNMANFSTLISYNRSSPAGSTWMLDTTGANAGGQIFLRARFDSQATGTDPAQGYNQNRSTSFVINDGAWHHIAMTYDASTRTYSLYGDYNLLATGTVMNNLIYDSSDLRLGSSGGGQGFNGLMDEVRLSNSVLGTNDFLRAIPEPSAALLGAFGLLALMRRKRN